MGECARMVIDFFLRNAAVVALGVPTNELMLPDWLSKRVARSATRSAIADCPRTDPAYNTPLREVPPVISR